MRGGTRGREHVVSLGCTTRAGKGIGPLMHGTVQPKTPGRPVLGRRLLAQHSRGWPSAANLKHLRSSILIAVRPCERHGTSWRSATRGDWAPTALGYLLGGRGVQPMRGVAT